MTGLASQVDTTIMRSMQFSRVGSPLKMVERSVPEPSANQVLVEIAACGVCRTDLHIVDGDIGGSLPIVPGHEVVGKVVAKGDAVSRFDIGDRVGIPWLGSTCGRFRQ